MSDQEAQNQEPITPGQILKQEREVQGLSIDEVHELTKIPMDAIRAIEDGYTIRTLSPFYRKSFIKIYAKCLELDAAEVLKSETDETTSTQDKENVDDMVVFSISPFFSKIFTPVRIRQIGVVLALIFVFFLLFKTLTFIISKISASFKKDPVQKEVIVKQTPAVKIEPVPVEKPIVKKPPPPPPRVVTPPPPPVAVAPVVKDVMITVRATGKTWLRVRSDEETVFQSTLQKGAVETWEANTNIEISGGIHKLEFELNGQMIGKLGRRDRRAKRVLFTKDGMEVQKDD